MTTRPLLATLALAGLLLTACGGADTTADPSPPSTPTPADSPTETGTPTDDRTTDPTGDPTAVGEGAAAYFLLDDDAHGGPHLVPVWVATADDVGASFDALMTGPSVAAPASPAMSTAIPEDTTVRSIEGPEDGVVRIDLSPSFDDGGGSTTMFARLLQVVHTATQFPDVDAVELLLDGEPVEVFSGEGIVLEQPLDRRDHLEAGIVPKLFVDRPAWGEPVPPTFTATGMARDLFEATFVYEVSDDEDEVLTRGPVTAEGSQSWNDFTVTIESGIADSRDVFLTVFEESMEDGSTIYLRRTPITVSPGRVGGSAGG